MTGTERKVFQKYYPPDFDPSKIPRAKGQRNRQFVQRVMAPYNMQCDTCHEYIYKGKKFNMRRETAEGETYLGLKIFRFYFRLVLLSDFIFRLVSQIEKLLLFQNLCPNCLAEITFKTDLENCDYRQEHGATRLFEAFKLYQQEEKAKETKEEEEKKDPMKMLEKRTKMSRAEMEALGKLEELQETNRRHETFGPDQYFQNLNGAQVEVSWVYMSLTEYKVILFQALRLQEEDEKFIQKLYGRTEDGKIIKRILDDENKNMDSPVPAKLEIKHEPVDEDQKPSCSSADVMNLKPGTPRQVNVVTNKRTSQRELLSRIVAVKKQKMEKNKPVIIKTEIQDATGSTEDSPEHSTSKQFETNRESQPISLISTLSALQGLADYCSDSSSD
uniref:Splicing factor YJU2 n=1 Tax=Wuchereria bancrofti TaxID=6293 RepID=A0A1I8EAI7_WUCBA